ncbi:MAG: DNA polymerase III subunit alpha [Leptospirales bacterium]|nr:DNA polymerase III subunit alpha [Leptospirales bacterium]
MPADISTPPAAAQDSDGLKFAHLHLHTSYSLLDGAIRIDSLMRHVRELGMNSVAMTDHGNMFGAVEFYRAAVKHGVKPIIGCEFYVAPGSRKEKKHVERLADGNNYHLILLAANREGYANLIRLASRSYTEGFYRKPRIDYALLSEHSQGLICLTACLGGEVQSKLLHGQQDQAQSVAGKLLDIFGRDRFFLEIQKHGLPEEELVFKGNLELARRNGMKLALTNDAHFLRRQDQAAQDILLRINQKKTIEDPLQFGFNSEFYVKSPAEMALLYPGAMEAFHNTALIAEMCDLQFDFGNPLLPRFETPPGHSLDSYMRELAWQGLEKRYNGQISPAVRERFEFEYGVISSMDFAGYFLIVQDFINWAKRNGIPVGPGRGSAAGSLVAFALGITDIDPLRYGLLFERFLNPDRKEMPDIDVDFCADRREEVINYVREKYGADRVGQIITYGTMAAKACLKDVARVLNIPFDEANNLSKMFPDVLNISLQEALDSSSELKAYSERGETQRRLFEVALTLEGNVRQTGVHAAGVVIAPQPLEDLVPLATVAARAGEKGAERVQVTQYDMSALTDVGLVKMDFLGLRNLTILDHALRGIRQRLGEEIDLQTIALDNAKAYELLGRGETTGVFQLESSGGMREFVMRIKPSRFEDLVALIALFRPGPLKAGMAESFINRKKGREKVDYPHADLRECLEDTYGVIVYQEQVMQISRIIGGFTAGQADALRKAMGKKIAEKMAEMRLKFVEGARQRGYAEKFASDLYDQMAKFAEYGFNKSHSAAYAMVVYQTAYFKANYPTDYMCAALNSAIGKAEDVIPYVLACKAMGIELLAPDVNASEVSFSVVRDGAIRYGLGAIKNAGIPAMETLVEARKTAPAGAFESFFQFAELADLRLCNRRAIESLVQAGAFQSLGYTRKALLASVELAMTHGHRIQQDRLAGQDSLFGALPGANQEVHEPVPRGKDALELEQNELLRLEKDVLGFYFSGHPLKRFEQTLKRIKAAPIERLGELASGARAEIAGVINDIQLRLTQKGKEMARLKIEDLTGTIEAVVFPQALERVRKDLQKDHPLFFSAIVEKREETGTPSVIVEGVRALDQELLQERQEKALHLKLSSAALDAACLGQLQAILRNHRGAIGVYFHLMDRGEENPTVIRAHDSFRVRYSQELRDSLAAMEQIRAIYFSTGGQITELYASASAPSLTVNS